MKKNELFLLLKNISSMKELKQIQAVSFKSGLNGDNSLVSHMILFCALSSSGSLDYAQSIFEETSMEDSFQCNIMLRAYGRSVFPMQAIHLYNRMRRKSVQSDEFTYPSVLKACGKIDVIEESRYKILIAKKSFEIHCSIIKLGLDRHFFVSNSLLSIYCKCGYLNVARQMFDEMEHKSVVSWNTMIGAYNKVHDFDSVDALIQRTPEKDLVCWNSQLKRYLNSGDMEVAENIFDKMSTRDSVTWNTMISGYVKTKNYSMVLKLFNDMKNYNVELTQVTITSVLDVCAEIGELEVGRDIHEYLKRNEFNIGGYLGTALIDMYAKCGNLRDAHEVFNEMEMKHITCWNSMIVALAVHGYSNEAIDLFSSLEKESSCVRPDSVTFIGVLVACTHKGLVEEGRRLFHKMIEDYRIKPNVKHYGCMVDLFSRWGLLKEAYEVIISMPFKPNSIVWRTLLSACKIHGNLELAEESFRKICELGCLIDGDFILLSNIYAEAERWKDVELLRWKMFHLGVSKKPGCSAIEN